MLTTSKMGGKLVSDVVQNGKSHIRHVSAKVEEHEIEPPTNVNAMKWKCRFATY